MLLEIKKRIITTFRAFKYRNYRLFFGGEFISLIGTWIQQIAISWLVYDITNSALLMGIIMFVNALPTLFLTPVAGVIVDRYNKHKMLVLTQILFSIQASIMAFLTLNGSIQIWQIIVLGIMVNSIASVDMPLRQALVVELVEDSSDLNNAISLNSSCFNLARLIGPAIAGVLIAMFGVGICFLLNAISYIPVIWAVLLMKFKTKIANTQKTSVFGELKEGLNYVQKTRKIGILIVFLAVISFIGMTYPLLMPILTKNVFGADARLLGYLMSAAGVGALLASLLLASKRTIKNLPTLLVLASIFLGISLFALGFAYNKIMAIILMFGVGFSMVGSLIISNTLIQYCVDDDKRGRVMSLHSLAFVGTIPFSNLLTGFIAENIGVMRTFILFGIIMFIVSLFFANKIKCLNFEIS